MRVLRQHLLRLRHGQRDPLQRPLRQRRLHGGLQGRQLQAERHQDTSGREQLCVRIQADCKIKFCTFKRTDYLKAYIGIPWITDQLYLCIVRDS